MSASGEGVKGNHASSSATISADGRFVTFQSTASNLVSASTNRSFVVFVHGRQEGTIELVSASSDGTPGNNCSRISGISADGSFVVFASVATNLVPDDANGDGDVFVHRLR